MTNDVLRALRMFVIIAVAAVLVFGFLFAVSASGADSTVFQRTASPGVWDSTYDAMINGGSPINNYGELDPFQLQKGGPRRAVISFPNIDQSTDFDADDCDSCFLQLKLQFALEDSTDLKVTAYKIDEYWTEGITASGDDSNYVSYNYRNDSTLLLSDRTGDTTWTTAGGEYSTPLDTIGIAFTAEVWYVWNIPKTVCSTWIASPSTNFGMLLKYTTETGGGPHRYFHASEHGTAANRPKFAVYWTTRDAAVSKPKRKRKN